MSEKPVLTEHQLMFRPGLLAGARILVTGGGTGLGRIMSEGCAASGATVFICGRREVVLRQTAAEINGALGQERVVPLVCDLRSEESIESMLDTIWVQGGALTGLINNAGANFLSRTEDVSVRGFDAIANTVLRGTFLVTNACGKRWLAAGNHASVVSILSTWVFNGAPFATPSAMAKAGVHAMTQSLAVEWGGRGIRFNAICPGAFPTQATAELLLTDEQSKGGGLGNPMGRPGDASELANLAIFLLSSGAAFINGQTIAIDGAGYQQNGANFSALTAWSDADWQAARYKIRNAAQRDKAARTI